MTTSRFELFDHTADIGVRVTAPTLAGLVAPATAGLYATIGELVAQPGGQWQTFELRGEDPALLLRDYLAELLHLFAVAEGRVTSSDVQEFTTSRLCVTVQVGRLDRRHSALLHEVKAITYHELAVRPTADGFEATYIVDI